MMADSNLNGDANVADKPSWERAHQMLVGLARTRAGLDLEEAKWLLAASRERVDRRLGYASFVEYIERLFGYAPRLTQERLRVGEALEQARAGRDPGKIGDQLVECSRAHAPRGAQPKGVGSTPPAGAPFAT